MTTNTMLDPKELQKFIDRSQFAEDDHNFAKCRDFLANYPGATFSKLIQFIESHKGDFHWLKNDTVQFRGSVADRLAEVGVEPTHRVNHAQKSDSDPMKGVRNLVKARAEEQEMAHKRAGAASIVIQRPDGRIDHGATQRAREQALADLARQGTKSIERDRAIAEARAIIISSPLPGKISWAATHEARRKALAKLGITYEQ